MLLKRRSRRDTSSTGTSNRFDSPVRIIRPQGWIALTALILLIGVGLGWAFFGEFAETVETDGILMRDGGLWTVTAPVDGVLESFATDDESGESIKSSEPMAVIRTDATSEEDDGRRKVFFRRSSQECRRVLRHLVQPEQRVRAGDALLQYEIASKPRQVVLYLDRRRGYRLAQEQRNRDDKNAIKAHVIPENAKLIESGYLLGTVKQVADYPATLDQMAARLGDRALARRWFDAGRNLEVVISFSNSSHEDTGSGENDCANADRGTADGDELQWSVKKGESIRLFSGVPCRVRIVIQENVSLAQRLFPGIGSQRSRDK